MLPRNCLRAARSPITKPSSIAAHHERTMMPCALACGNVIKSKPRTWPQSNNIVTRKHCKGSAHQPPENPRKNDARGSIFEVRERAYRSAKNGKIKQPKNETPTKIQS